jgi:hypothetical protein
MAEPRKTTRRRSPRAAEPEAAGGNDNEQEPESSPEELRAQRESLERLRATLQRKFH